MPSKALYGNKGIIKPFFEIKAPYEILTRIEDSIGSFIENKRTSVGLHKDFNRKEGLHRGQKVSVGVSIKFNTFIKTIIN